MTIAEVRQKATEGGYRINGSDGMDSDDAGVHSAYAAYTRSDNDATCVAEGKEPWLDPQFWRVLGLALGWHEGVATKCLIYDQWWREPWHRFIDHLADGHTPAAFFARLPSPASPAPRRQHV
jgi:hypothetical protein